MNPLPCVSDCRDGEFECPAHSSCADLDPGFDCVCDSGFQRGTNGTCVDVDECAVGVTAVSNNCGTNSICVNSIGTHRCFCDADSCHFYATCRETGNGANSGGNGAVERDFECACLEGFEAGEKGVCFDMGKRKNSIFAKLSLATDLEEKEEEMKKRLETEVGQVLGSATKVLVYKLRYAIGRRETTTTTTTTATTVLFKTGDNRRKLPYL